MTLDEYIHKYLMVTDDFYESLGIEDEEDFIQQFKKTVFGRRVILQYLIDKYIRRII